VGHGNHKQNVLPLGEDHGVGKPLQNSPTRVCAVCGESLRICGDLPQRIFNLIEKGAGDFRTASKIPVKSLVDPALRSGCANACFSPCQPSAQRLDHVLHGEIHADSRLGVGDASFSFGLPGSFNLCFARTVSSLQQFRYEPVQIVGGQSANLFEELGSSASHGKIVARL
jgi:hypothetical protein